ncbi:MAG: patatin-like phospholipase family protein [Pseudomonadota bacterium]
MTDTSGQKRMLTMDGGGLMGLISLGILKKVEDDLREAHGGDPNFVLRDYFDYIGGTSTGAIIAAGLMIGRSVQNLTDIYLNHGRDMFTPASLWSKAKSGFSHKYDNTFLNNMLKKEFSDHSIEVLQNQGVLPMDKHLLMVTRRYDTDSPWPLSTNRAAKYNDLKRPDSNLKLPLWQVIRASTAAPSFFQPEWITMPGGGPTRPFVDGGLTPHNNPAMKIFEMATRPEYACEWEPGEDKLMICSIGTGFTDRVVRDPKPMGQPIWSLAMTTPSDLMHGINTAIDVACRSIGRCRWGYKLDGELGTMMEEHGAPRATVPAFTYARYQVDVGPENMRAMKEAGAEIKDPNEKLVMDDVDQMGTMYAVGKYASAQVDMKTHFSQFMP